MRCEYGGAGKVRRNQPTYQCADTATYQVETWNGRNQGIWVNYYCTEHVKSEAHKEAVIASLITDRYMVVDYGEVKDKLQPNLF